MPYKDPKKRAEAVRRHKERKRIAEADKKWVGNFLTEYCKFGTWPFRFLVEKIQEDCILEGDGIRLRSTGKLMDEPEVYFGLNMIVWVETIHVTRDT